MEKHSESKDHHHSRWIPSTPAKVGLDKLEPIAEKQVQPSQEIWSQSCQRNTSKNETTANAVTNSITDPLKNNNQALIPLCEVEISDPLESQYCGDIRNVFSEFNDVPLQDLLGHLIAKAPFSASKQISLNDETRASATRSSALQHDFESRIHFVPETPQRVSFHFEPLTPDLSSIIDKINVSTPANLCVATEMQKEDAKSFDIQNNQSEFVENKSSGPFSPIMEENLESGKATEQQTDMTKTPVKKQRKRKHRPKVIVEGQTKNTHNQRTPKPTLQEVTTPKRKYVRKSKPVDVLLDDKANGAAQAAKPQGSEVTPKSKKKYVRRKKVDQPTTPLEDGNTTTDTKTAQATRRSCRKSLNFGIESQAAEGSSRELHSDPDIEYIQEKEGSILNDDPLIKESQASCSPTSCMSSRGKCQIVFSDVTHDKEVSTSKTMASEVKRVTKRSNSKCSSSASLSPETQARKSKRRRLSTTDALEPCNINAAGAHYNSMQAYQEIIPPYEYNRGEIPNMHFPAIFKKRRSEASHKSALSSILLTSITTDYNNRYCTYPSNDLTILDPAAFEINKNECLQTLADAKKLTKKRSKGVNRVWDLDSLLENSRQLPASSNGTGNSEDLHGPFVCMEALAESHGTVATKKRSNRFVVSSASVAKSIGSIILKDTAAVDAIAEKFGCPGVEEQNALIPYQADHRCQTSRAIVPVKDQIRKPRPKVELDNETDRVWRLLLEDINSEGINGTDEQKAKWWDEEREVFRLRTESFIARMHLVQGDRRFTPWKGSVLDSVIGVFLTQNVSDHLSSSAFISMAARFPLKLGNDHHNTYLCKERSAVSRVLNPADTLECHRKVSSPPAEIHDSMTLSNEEEINTGVSLGNKYEGTTTIIHPISLSLYASECLRKLYNEPDLNKFGSRQNEMLASFNGDQRELDEGIYSLNSADSIGQCSQSSTEAEPTGWAYGCTSFVELLQMAGTMSHGVYRQQFGMQSYFGNPAKSGGIPYNLQSVSSGYQEIDTFEGSRFFEISKENELSVNEQSGLSPEASAGTSSQNTVASSFEELQKLPSEDSLSEIELVPMVQNQENHRICEGSNAPRSSQGELDNLGKNLTRERARKHLTKKRARKQKAVETNKIDGGNSDPGTAKAKRRKTNRKEKKEAVDWDELRKQAQANGRREKTLETMDSVDWEAVRCADVKEIADAIKERGMNNMLGERIKDFLNRMVREHGEIDLEWLRDVPPDRAKEYLLSVRGLGLKSVECVRLLTLHHLAFPVDTNVGRIAVRLGWVPLQPLPESLQLHLLEMYPVLESIQKYLWPRLCKLDQRTLYELHYQMITFGKVFCTKNKPNCNACPMRAECRHFASAYASARLPLPAPEEKSIVRATENRSANRYSPSEIINRMQLTQPETNQRSGVSYQVRTLGPIVEEPKTPEPENTQVPEIDIEDTFEDDDEIPRIKLNIEELKETITNIVQHKVQEGEISKALMVLDAETASIPMPKLKSINRLRTEHRVYELPDSHPLLQGFERREPDDPSPYLLAIWTPGETVNSIQPPESACSFQETGKLCDQETCFSCNSKREADTQTVRGTVLIPCRTAMRGSFPLNGTYFQVNEMFADHESSLNPIDVPREWLWNLPRRMVYFGTSIPTIFKGLSQPEIQYCFWKGFVCVRGFDKKTRAPRPLVARLHFPASKLTRTRTRGRTNE